MNPTIAIRKLQTQKSVLIKWSTYKEYQLAMSQRQLPYRGKNTFKYFLLCLEPGYPGRPAYTEERTPLSLWHSLIPAHASPQGLILCVALVYLHVCLSGFDYKLLEIVSLQSYICPTGVAEFSKYPANVCPHQNG